MRRLGAALLVLACLAWAPRADACLWDNDTLAMERGRFPQALELIAGKFPRHSRAFYAWRIRDRLPKIDASAASHRLLDDVAVAYDKTGQHDLAIWAMVLKEQTAPGAYETYANLGTFLVHRGDFAAGLPFIEQALKVNSKAHFGREEVQQLLVQYVLSVRTAGRTGLPLRVEGLAGRFQRGLPPPPGGFALFLKERGRDAGPKAVQAVLGMMRFGNHASVVLLEVLADLLVAPFDKDGWQPTRIGNAIANQRRDAKRLATRAYLKASIEVADPASKEAYRRMALATLQSQSAGAIGAGQESLGAIQERFDKEIADAERYVARVWADEQLWIDRGLDAERMFTLKYLSRP
jgi:hypothetical protein